MNTNKLTISSLARWIDFQLSTIIEGTSAGYSLGNNNTVWIDKGATVFAVSLANGKQIDIESDKYNTAEEIAKAIISVLHNNTPETYTDMETNSTTLSNLRGQAKHTYNRVMSAIAEDNAVSMCHTFTTLTQQAKTIVLQCGKFSNLYVRGEHKGMTAEEAAKDLTARCVACVSCKVRNIDIVIATLFLAEYINRQRKEIEAPKPTTPETDADMNTSKINTDVNSLSTLKKELQQYYDNAAKGGDNRRRTMILLRWDIRKMERELQNN